MMIKLQTDLNIPSIWIDMTVQEGNGQILQEYSEEGHSWVRNFYTQYSMAMIDLGSVAEIYLQTTEGSIINHTSYRIRSGEIDRTYEYYAGEGIVSGIILGTSSTPFHVADYYLYGVINHGNSAGQLYHQAVSRTQSYDPITQNIKTTHRRIFNNNSGGTISVREAGLVFVLNFNESDANRVSVLMSRDVLSIPITVPHGTLLTVTYTLTSPSLTLRNIPLGTKGSGGYYAGTMHGSTSAAHKKYGFIVAPITGEVDRACHTTWNASTGITDEYNGYSNTQSWIALGASSPMGVFCDDINNGSPNLGGYTDWYIPSNMEMQVLFPRVRNLMDLADSFTNTDYYSSTDYSFSGTYQKGGNPVTSSWSNLYSKATVRKVRLIRRILVDEFIPDVVTP